MLADCAPLKDANRQKACLRHLEARRVLRYHPLTQFAEPITGSETLNIDMSNASPEMDYAAHLATYRDFIRFLKYGVICVAVILIGMKIFLV
jgi:hypothetical protein